MESWNTDELNRKIKVLKKEIEDMHLELVLLKNEVRILDERTDKTNHTVFLISISVLILSSIHLLF